eukprot:10505715-Prorocentrum_lima.AAC.1
MEAVHHPCQIKKLLPSCKHKRVGAAKRMLPLDVTDSSASIVVNHKAECGEESQEGVDKQDYLGQ